MKTTFLDTDRLYYQVLYFFLGGTSAFTPFLILYFKALGLSSVQTGTLVGIRPFSELFTPLWGWVADKYKKRRIILQLAIVSTVATTLLMLLVQPPRQECIERIGEQGNMTQPTPLEFLHNKTAVDSATRPNSSTELYELVIDRGELDFVFVPLLVLVISGQIVGCVMYSFPDVLTVAYLEESVEMFGRIKVWMDVGQGLALFVVGIVISGTAKPFCGNIVHNYSIAFYFYAAYLGLVFVTSFKLNIKYQTPARDEIDHRSILKSVCSLRMILLLVVAVFSGASQGMNDSFGWWFLDDLGGSSLLISVAAGLRQLVSFIGYYTSPWFITSFGELRVITMCLVSHAFLYFLISVMEHPWTAVVVIVVQGGLTGLIWCSLVAYWGRFALQIGYTATMQGLLCSMYFGLGLGGGIELSGLLVGLIGIPVTFQCYALASTLLFTLILLSTWNGPERQKNQESYEYLPVFQQYAERERIRSDSNESLEECKLIRKSP